ncbi:hypothetical protein LB504_004799 [Fusarium proliferatum]|nr:hypothetical protein LB504_004799 [Fusarium proliferatum]
MDEPVENMHLDLQCKERDELQHVLRRTRQANEAYDYRSLSFWCVVLCCAVMCTAVSGMCFVWRAPQVITH